MSKNEDFFTFYSSFLLFTQMFLRQFCLGNNLPMDIKKNTVFLWLKLQQLLSAKANFEGCIYISYIYIYHAYHIYIHIYIMHIIYIYIYIYIYGIEYRYTNIDI